MKIEVYVYTGGDLLRPQAHVFTDEGDPDAVLAEHRRNDKGGPDVTGEQIGEFEGGVELDHYYWTQEQAGEWLSRQPTPSFEDLDTGIVYEMEESDLPRSVTRYRRLWG